MTRARTSPKVYDGIADFEAHVGEHLGFSDWRQVTQKEIDLFAEATGDHQWIHVDPEKAAAGPYGKTIAHGYLTLSLVPILVQQIYRVTGLAMQVNYGSDKLRFPPRYRSIPASGLAPNCSRLSATTKAAGPRFASPSKWRAAIARRASSTRSPR